MKDYSEIQAEQLVVDISTVKNPKDYFFSKNNETDIYYPRIDLPTKSKIIREVEPFWRGNNFKDVEIQLAVKFFKLGYRNCLENFE